MKESRQIGQFNEDDPEVLSRVVSRVASRFSILGLEFLRGESVKSIVSSTIGTSSFLKGLGKVSNTNIDGMHKNTCYSSRENFSIPNILASKNKSNIIPVISCIFSFSSGIKETVGLGIFHNRVIFGR